MSYDDQSTASALELDASVHLKLLNIILFVITVIVLQY